MKDVKENIQNPVFNIKEEKDENRSMKYSKSIGRFTKPEED